MNFQRDPPHIHQQNSATLKHYPTEGLAICDPDFPPIKWDCLVPQCDITINFIRSSRRQPNLSAHACLYRSFEFNRRPIAPPGTKVVIRKNFDQRDRWSNHSIEGWYIGPAIKHYRCHKYYIPSTSGDRDVLTLDWFPQHNPFPKVSTKDCLRHTASNMLFMISMKKENTIPSLRYG